VEILSLLLINHSEKGETLYMEEEYVTINDAMRLTGYSLRQIDRYIKDGILEVIDHQKNKPRKISRASIDAFNAERGYRPVDEVDALKQESLAQKQITGDTLLQVAAIRAQVADLERLVKRMFAELEAKIHAQAGHRSRGSTPPGPDEAIMLVRFAEAHAVPVGRMRNLAEHDPSLATVIKRPDAQSKKHKWMIVPEQMAHMLAALQAHGTAYTPCASCPHAGAEHLRLAQ
jgi:hypothetical protein